jgi:hypothetical protein
VKGWIHPQFSAHGSQRRSGASDTLTSEGLMAVPRQLSAKYDQLAAVTDRANRTRDTDDGILEGRIYL